jgi:flagellar biosynthesis protein FlhB
MDMILNPWSSDIVLEIILPVYSWFLLPFALSFAYKVYKLASKRTLDYEKLARYSSWLVPAVSIYLAITFYWYIYLFALGILYFTLSKDIERLKLTDNIKRHYSSITFLSFIFTILIILILNLVFGLTYYFFPK